MTQLPPQNPLQSAYASFLSETPIVTRYIMITYTITFISSMFLPLSMAIINMPYFTIFKFELYRIFLSNFVCESLINLIFGFLSFVNQGKRLEYSIGSTNFALVFLFIGIASNVLFTIISMVIYVLDGNYQPHLMHESGGIWQMILGIIAMECSYAPEGSRRRLFFVEVPTLYYPFALLAIFTLFFGLSEGSFLFHLLPYLLSTLLGYAFGFGKLDFVKLNVERRRGLESGIIRSLTSRPDWVAGPTTDDWVMIAPTGMNSYGNNNADVESGWTPTIFQPQQDSANNRESNAQSGSGNRLGAIGNSSSGTNPNSSTGMTNRRLNDKQSGRAALLAAAERRAMEQNNS